MDGAKASAAGTGLLGAQLVGLVFQQRREGSFGQAGGGGASNLLHRVQIDLQAGPGLAEGVPGNNFAPTRSQVTDFLEVLRGEFALRHGQSCLALTRMGWDAFCFP